MPKKKRLRILSITTLRALPNQPSVHDVAREIVAVDEAYYWDAKRVVGKPHAILQYTVRGEGRLHYRGQAHRLTPGTAFFVHNMDPDLAYHSDPDSNQEWEILWCNVIPGETLAADMIARHGPIYHMPPDSWFLGQLNQYLSGDQNFVQLKLADSLRLMAALLIELVECSTKVLPEKKSGLLMQGFCEFVHSQITEPLSVVDAADHLRISREHLSRMCQEQLHTTPAAYINSAKMREAAALLRNPQNSIKQVAHQLGYENASHFSRVFRRFAGVSPRDYRSTPSLHPISPFLV